AVSCWKMAVEPWNKLNIAFPSSKASFNIQRSEGTENCIKALVKACKTVLNLLRSRSLKVEQKTLIILLHTFYNRLRQHKTYRALKRVEQCFKRLNCMNLEGSIEDLVHLCPSKFKRSAVKNTDEYPVPSQPVLEWVTVKILGGCKLFLCLLDSCSKAFLLSIQHLYWEEYIVLNIVVLGLLSRIWVLFRGILKHLEPLYEKLFALLREVSAIQNLPYVKGYVFPIALKTFLGPSYSKLIKLKLLTVSPLICDKVLGATGLLNRLFSAEQQPPLSAHEDRDTEAVVKGNKKAISRVLKIVDLGCQVQKKRASALDVLEFDVKSLCKRPNYIVQEVGFNSIAIKTKAPLRRQQNVFSGQPFGAELQAARSFSELVGALRKVTLWCRKRKLTLETCYLRHRLSKCNRLKQVEALGYSLNKKLDFIKTAICKSLSQPRNIQRKRAAPGRRWSLRNWQHLRQSYSTSNKSQPGDLKWKNTEFGRRWSLQNLRHVKRSSSTSKKIQTAESKSELTVAKSKIEIDDIDDIFASIGL
uniref:Nucleolus and neural progenitor protein n=1 Tax=Latimeria chalumnae TaxID=7897 RepID=H3AJM9_LATCH